MFYVYVLQSSTSGELYVGWTRDLVRRFQEHNDGKNRSTRFNAPFQLVYYEAYRQRSDAVRREKQLKRHAGALTHLKKRISGSLL